MKGHIEFTAFDGPLTHRQIAYGIYRPPNYPHELGGRYPVFYHLHGLNEDHTAHIDTLAEVLETGALKGIIPPMVVVSPNGYTNSMWVDSKDGSKPAETNLMRELIPHLKGRYGLATDRRLCIIGGFSMGGYGALRFALKYPECFRMCVSMDGAIHTLKSFTSFRSDIFAEVFQNDPVFFKRQCVYEWARKNAQRVRGRSSFLLLVGVLSSFNERFRRYMDTIGLPIDAAHFIKTGCDHDPGCLLDRGGDRLTAWLGAHLAGEFKSQ